MYKLTYESDEDISVPVDHVPATTDTESRYTMDEDVIYDKSKDAKENDLEKARSRTMMSAVMSAHAVNPESGAEKKKSRKFYQMFNNTSQDDLSSPSKVSTNSAAIGCKSVLLTFYLLLLTGVVVFLLVMLQGMSVKQHRLNDRVEYLQRTINVMSGGLGKPVITDFEAPPLPSDTAIPPPVPPVTDHDDSVVVPPPPLPVSSSQDSAPPAVRSAREAPSCCADVSTKLEVSKRTIQQINSEISDIQTNAIRNHANMQKRLAAMDYQIKALRDKSNSLEMQDVTIEDQLSRAQGNVQTVNAGTTSNSASVQPASSACSS
uniref:Uncharacterized protein n=1 Tax=Ciona savignyi TaxID=51511 RepID=H2YUR1_CIOSA